MLSIRSRWPTELLLPLLVASLEASAIAPLLHLLFSPAQTLNRGHPAPWPWMLGVIGLVAYWSARILTQGRLPMRSARATSLLVWLLATVAWISLQYGGASIAAGLRGDPGDRAYLLIPLALAFVAWWRGAGLGSDPDAFHPEALHREGRIAWTILVGTVLVAALLPGPAARDALASARMAVPVAVVTGLLAAAAGQIEQARRSALKRKGNAPGRMGWLAFAGTTAALIVLAGILVGGLLGEDVWRILYQPVLTGTVWLLYGVEYLILGIALVIFIVLFPFLWLARFVMKAASPADQQAASAPSPADFARNAEDVRRQLPAELTMTLRWVLVVLVVIVIATLVAAAMRRYRTTQTDEAVDEQRESMWDRSLLLQQLRRPFSRIAARPRPVTVDLSRPPATVREAYRNLTLMAARQGLGRRDSESASVYSRRLVNVWPDVSGPISDLTERYLWVRYGNAADEEHLPRALSDWADIRRYHSDDEATPHDNAAE